MKRKLFTTLFTAIVLLGIGIIANGCAPDNALTRLDVQQMIETNNQTEVQQMIDANNQKLEFTHWKIVNIKVDKNQWKWNAQTSQYEVIADLPELEKFIYEEGAAIAYIFLGEQGKDEVQKILPYTNSYYVGDDVNGNPIIFSETISCDFQLGNPSSVAFYIKASDLAEDPDAPQSYTFRIVLLW